MSDIARVLDQLGGIGRRAQLLDRGVSRPDIDHALARGAVIRVRQGVYATPAVDPAVLSAARHGGEVACGAALRAHGVWVLSDEHPARSGANDRDHRPMPRLHVWMGPSGRQHAHAGCRCRAHHEIGDRPVGFGIVEVLLALVQYAVCGTPEGFFAALESALQLGLIPQGGLATLRSRVSEHLHWLVDFASDQADSGLESLLRLRLHLRGIALQSQVEIAGVGRVDFLLAGRIILEADGRENHERSSKRHKDLLRDAEAAAQGYETLRFDYVMILFRWDLVLAAIEGRLAVLQSRQVQDDAARLQDR